MPHQHGRQAESDRSVRIELRRGIHRWIFQCDSMGREALCGVLGAYASDPGSGLTEADALFVRRRVAEEFGLRVKIGRG